MSNYKSIYKGAKIDETISTVLNGQAGLQGVSVNGSEITPDANNKVNLSIPGVLQTTGTSTTEAMSQNAVTIALGTKANTSDLSTVATSGSYNDLSNKPTIPSVVQATGSSTTDVMSQNAVTTSLSSKVDSSSLATVATSGSYSDLSNKPAIPSVVQTTGSSPTYTMSQQAITNALSGKASVSTYNATLLSSGWTGSSAPYTQTVSVSGILSTDKVFADVVLDSSTSTALDQSRQWAFVSQMTTSNGSITAKCLEYKPEINLPISLLALKG